MSTHDAIVVGGGLVGTAIAYGLAKQGLATLLLDEGDVAHRASRGNFGLVWVQSKGLGAPHYQRWTWRSAPGSTRRCTSRAACTFASPRRSSRPAPATWRGCSGRPGISAWNTACCAMPRSAT